MGDFSRTARAGNRPQGGLPQQNQSPTGWAPTKTQNIAERLAKKRAAFGGPLGLAGLVGLQHLLVDQQLG